MHAVPAAALDSLSPIAADVDRRRRLHDSKRARVRPRPTGATDIPRRGLPGARRLPAWPCRLVTHSCLERPVQGLCPSACLDDAFQASATLPYAVFLALLPNPFSTA
eukprot:360136-Chlamydomonas_euryale.AAC.6